MILVSLAERRTEIVTGGGLSLSGLDAVSAAGNSFFGAEDFDSGIIAIIGSLDQVLTDPAPPTPPATTSRPSSDDGSQFGRAIFVAILIGGGTMMIRDRVSKGRNRTRRKRREQIDEALARLEPAGQDLIPFGDYRAAAPQAGLDGITTTDGMEVLRRVGEDESGADPQLLEALWSARAIEVIDREKLLGANQEPLELRASGERRMLEDAVQVAARAAEGVPLKDGATFGVSLAELRRLVTALTPHRIAAARRRMAEAMADSLSTTAVGAARLTDLGERLLRAAAAFDGAAPLASSIAEMDAAYAIASDKTERLERLYARLPAGTARPAVAAALADIDNDVDSAVAQYEKLRLYLDDHGDALEGDGLEIPAIAALLLMNSDEDNADRFLSTYQRLRRTGSEPAEAVEYALAGLRDPDEITRVRTEARRLTLPISITTALLRRRDDGIAVYEQLLAELAGRGVKSQTRRTIAGILAVSLEPALAVGRWAEAREALADLGLDGAYADIAAAFGASDRRGPRQFALAYAAQCQALARSAIDDADLFAPELAHEGTSGRTDSWSGRPIPRGYGSFDPFTFFYYHWVITRGSSGSYGWEPVHRDPSWGGDRGSWWGGGGGFGGSGSSWGGSSWGSSGGGGGFGGGSSGGSGW